MLVSEVLDTKVMLDGYENFRYVTKEKNPIDFHYIAQWIVEEKRFAEIPEFTKYEDYNYEENKTNKMKLK